LQRLHSISATNSPNSLRHNLQSNKTHQKHNHIKSKIYSVVEAPCHAVSNQATSLN
jgi:hypothetical protein